MSQDVSIETKRRIVIFINDQRVVAPAEEMTGQELMVIGKIPEGNHLFLEVNGPGDDRQIQPDEPVQLRSGMRFYDVPVGNLG